MNSIDSRSINNNSISWNYNKIKILLLIIITIVMTLSNYFYNLNYNFEFISDESKTILSIFELHDKKKTKLRNLKEEDNGNIKFNNTNEINNRSNLSENNPTIDESRNSSKIVINNIKQKIMNDLSNYNFKLEWKSLGNNKIFKIGDSKEGKGTFYIKKSGNSNKNNYFNFVMKFTEEDYFDSWKIFNFFISLDDIEIQKTSDNIYITGSFKNEIYEGEYFDINEESLEFIDMKMKISFPLNNQEFIQNSTIYLNDINEYKEVKLNVNNFSIEMEAQSGIKLIIDLKILQKEIENKLLENQINIYVIISTFTSLLYIIGIYTNINNIKKNDSIFSNINIVHLTINSIWNTYSCLANINIYLRYAESYNTYILLILISGLKFILFDFWLLHSFWGKRRNEINSSSFVKEKVKFYFIYYSFVLSSFLFINDFFFNYFYISTFFVLLWVPQIYYNIVYDVKYIYPFIYIIGTTLDKLINPLYFRGIRANFLHTKDNIIFVIILIIFVILTIIIMYIQLFKGARILLPKKYQKNKFDFYKTKDELIKINNNIKEEECIICLSPIFEEIILEMEDKKGNTEVKGEKLDIKEDKEEKKTSSDDDSIQNSENILENNDKIEKHNMKENSPEKENEPKKEEKSMIYENSILCLFKKYALGFAFVLKVLFYENFFNFYKMKDNKNEKKYMYTPCNHIFHYQCLEKWFEYKKECPNCRKNLNGYF